MIQIIVGGRINKELISRHYEGEWKILEDNNQKVIVIGEITSDGFLNGLKYFIEQRRKLSLLLQYTNEEGNEEFQEVDRLDIIFST